MPDAVMIFAAGFGTRMGALTRSCPKPLLQVGGRTLLDHALDLTDHARVTRRVVNVHYRSGDIMAHLEPRTDIGIADESDRILDTGGGLKAARAALSADPVFTLNSDAVWSDPSALDTLSQAWDPARMDALLLTVPLDRAHGRNAPGDFSQAADGALSRGGDLVYTGAQIVSLAGLDGIAAEVFSLNLLWNRYAETGRLFGVTYPGHWADVGHPEGLVLANRLWAEWP
ncbi:nucleotidyltransferase family protein [Tropicimonas sp. S265A]|uniref:nucleotidyltransferase family protein n=1 Tax=Tropicimonas sp. S265A TaxID=3415134 RepID=UPI003C7B1C48